MCFTGSQDILLLRSAVKRTFYILGKDFLLEECYLLNGDGGIVPSLIFKCLSNLKMHIWCLKTFIPYPLLSGWCLNSLVFKWKHTSAFLLLTPLVFPTLFPRKAILVDPPAVSWPPQRKGAWSPWSEPGVFARGSQNTLAPFIGCAMYYWRDLGKRCPLALVLLLVDLPPLPSLRNVVMGGGPRDFKFNVMKSPKEETSESSPVCCSLCFVALEKGFKLSGAILVLCKMGITPALCHCCAD